MNARMHYDVTPGQYWARKRAEKARYRRKKIAEWLDKKLRQAREAQRGLEKVRRRDEALRRVRAMDVSPALKAAMEDYITGRRRSRRK